MPAPLQHAAAAAMSPGRGLGVHIAPLRPQDAAALQRFVRGLSAHARYMRFQYGLRELSPILLSRLTQIDQQDHVALVAHTAPSAWGSDGERQLVADARYVRLGDSGDAEFALVVADDWQGQGLARELLGRLMDRARRQGLKRLLGEVLWDNHAMLAMTRRLGGRLVVRAGHTSVVQVQFEL
ncbi:MAG: GNAT family N-acetyltransferase [Burkholderiaceae bacterium]|nr:GNAT family N-acetyltransferase [Burkholderiaceae bacterium]